MAKNDIPTKVIPFLLSEEDVKKRLYETLVDTDYVPTDIFDALSIGHVSKVYLPMYRYNGTFKAYWSCTAIYRKERTVGNKTEYYNEYQPASGISTGGFDILCLANEGSIMPSKLRSFTSLMDNEHSYRSKAITYERWLEDFKEDEKTQIYPANKDEDRTWNSPNVNHYIDRLANSAACRQAPFNRTDFSMTWNCDASRGELILVGFWMIEYSYRGNPCYYIVDGIGFNKDYSVPIDKEEKGKVKQVNNKLWLVVLACLLFCGIGLYAMFGSFYDDYSNVENGGLLLVISSIISLILLCVRLGKIKKDIKETARQKRNAGKLKYCKEPAGPGRIDSPNNNVNLQIGIAFVLMVLLVNYTFTPKTEEVQVENEIIKELDSIAPVSPVEIQSEKEIDSQPIDYISTSPVPVNLKMDVKITPLFTERVKKYEELGTYSEGLALAKRNKKWGYIDVEGNEVIPCQFDGEIRGGHGHSFSDGLAIILKNGKHGYIDKIGNIVIDAIYDEVGDFSEGIACVQKNYSDNLIFIDKQGMEIKHLSDKFIWDWNLDRKLPKFRNGVCRVHVLRPKDERYEGDFVDVIWININGEQVSPPYITEENEDLKLYWSEENGVSKMGYKDKKGNIIIPAKYSSIGDFSHGVAVASLKYGTKSMSGGVSEGYIRIDGYVDMNGNDTFSDEDFLRIENAYKNKPKDEWW